MLDYSGLISREEGISRIKVINKYINKQIQNKSRIKLLLDVRNTIWETEETHNALSKMARQKFNIYQKNNQIYLAVLNNELNSHIDETEGWFTDEDSAIQWLSRYELTM